MLHILCLTPIFCSDIVSDVQEMSHDAIKAVFGVSDGVGHKLVCTFSEKSYNLEFLDISRGGILLSV